MPAIGSTVDTLVNWAKSRDPNGSQATIVELLNQSNEMITFLKWREGNLPLGNRTSVRIVLPTVNTRQIGAGVVPSITREAQFDDSMAILEAWNEVDCKLAELEADVGAYRFMKSRAYFEAMSQKFGQLFFYGNTATDMTQFNGFAPRYATIQQAVAASALNVLDGGGTASANTSMWLLTTGEGCMTGIFPKGSVAGIKHTDWGKQISTLAAGYPNTNLAVYRDQFTWDCGIALEDWRWCSRIANIDVNNLTAQNGAANLIELMIKATYRMPSISLPPSTTGNPQTDLMVPGYQFFVCNRTVREMLHIQAVNKTNNMLTFETYFGKKVLTFMGIPVLNSDQLVNNEAQVT